MHTLSSLAFPLVAAADPIDFSWATGLLGKILILAFIGVAVWCIKYVIDGKVSKLLTILVCCLIAGVIAGGAAFQWGQSNGGSIIPGGGGASNTSVK